MIEDDRRKPNGSSCFAISDCIHSCRPVNSMGEKDRCGRVLVSLALKVGVSINKKGVTLRAAY